MQKLIIVTAIVILAACQKPLIELPRAYPETPVLTSKQSFLRNNFLDYRLADSLKIIADESLSGLPYSSFLQYSGELIFTTHNGYLYFLDLDNFDEIRKTHLADAIITAPTLLGNRLFIAASQGKYGLVAYNIESGNIDWNLQAQLSQSSPLIYNDIIVHASINGKIKAYKASDKTLIWSAAIDDQILNDLSLSGKQLIVATQNGQIRNYDVESGTLNWSQDLDYSIYASPVLSEKEVFIASYQGIIFKFDLLSGNRLNTMKLKSAIIETPAFDGDILYVGQTDGTFLALNNKLTKTLWSIQLNGPFSFAPLVSKAELVVGTAARYLYRINKINGSTIQEIKLKGRPKIQPTVFKNRMYIAFEPDNLIIMESME